MVTLASKIYVDGDARQRAQKSLAGIIENLTADVVVDTDIEIGPDGFPTVTVEGPDATAVRSLLAETFGLIPDQLDPGETYVGTLSAWDDTGFTLDAGTPVQVPADRIGLGPGTPEQLRTRFGLVQHLPLEFVYDDPPRLSEAQRDQLYEWRRGPGRVNVNSATRSEVRATINRAGHAQDIVTVERLGILEHSIICRDQTDPPGLIAEIGPYLPAELYAVVG